jgi:SNF2 family DNA or RNA helicase
MAAKQLQQEGLVKKVLCIVLAPLRTQWRDEVHKFTYEKAVVFSDFRAKYKTVRGKRKVSVTVDQQKRQFIENFRNSDAMFMIASYQALQQNETLFEKVGFDMIIFDEAHFINNKLSKTNKAATMLIKPRTKRHKKGYNKGIQYIIYASGTPITNYPDQIFGIVRTGNEEIFGNWRDFRDMFCVMNDYKDIVGYKNLDKLRRRTQNFFIRRTDKEIEMSLPKIVEDDIYIDPHPKQLKADKELLKYQKELIDARNKLLQSGKKMEAKMIGDRLKSVLSQRRIASNHPNLWKMSPNEATRERYRDFMVKDEMSIPKFERCIELVQEIVDSGHKVVIFTESRRMTVLLHRAVSEFTKAVRYVGGLSDKVRDRRKRKFNEDPRCRVMIANQAGSTGLNLQAGRYLINYDLPDTPAIWEQRKYRIRRLDSKHDRVYIINLINRGMVDEQILTKLKDKQAAFDFVIENDEASSQVHREIAKKSKKKRKEEKAVEWN